MMVLADLVRAGRSRSSTVYDSVPLISDGFNGPSLTTTADSSNFSPLVPCNQVTPFRGKGFNGQSVAISTATTATTHKAFVVFRSSRIANCSRMYTSSMLRPVTAAQFRSRINTWPNRPETPSLSTLFESFGVAESNTALVFGGDNGLAIQFPVDLQIWIIPGQCAFALWRIIIGCLVEHVCLVRNH